jgi:hypothetical protein
MDISQRKDVSAEHPDIVKRLEELAEGARADLGDALTKRKGAGVRPALTVGPAGAQTRVNPDED